MLGWPVDAPCSFKVLRKWTFWEDIHADMKVQGSISLRTDVIGLKGTACFTTVRINCDAAIFHNELNFGRITLRFKSFAYINIRLGNDRFFLD
jgi:hypothetical protein